MSVLATNTGNRTVNLTYLGYGLKKDGENRPLPILPYNHAFNSTASLAPSEMFESQFHIDGLIKVLKVFSRENRNIKLFLYAEDTEGKEYIEYMKEDSTVGDLLNFLTEEKKYMKEDSTVGDLLNFLLN